MEHYTPRDHATSNVLAWTATNSANVEPSVEDDAGAETDEPPECTSRGTTLFHRTPIRRGSEHQESLLTKALQSQSEDDADDSEHLRPYHRRRSITSNTSFASTALTCSTGFTTPARTSSPSPRLPSVGFAPLAAPAALEKRRRISFACAAKPNRDEKTSMAPPPRPAPSGIRIEGPPKKTTIKFACPSRPPSTPKGPGALEKQRSSSTIRAFRSPTSRRTPGSPAASRNKKWLTADSSDLESESARFHEFASDEMQEDDWIRRDYSTQPKLTIDDTLKKELAIRKLGKEAEEEAELEDQIDEENDEEVDEADLIDDDDDDDDEDGDGGDDDDEDGDEDDEDEDEEGQDDDAATEHALQSEASDGYKTDNETGFADSDDSDDDLVLWTTRIGQYPLSGAEMMARRLSQGEKSDSSIASNRQPSQPRKKRSKTRPLAFRTDTPELPDSTDFVCGTLDEDRPLEEAYISRVEARRRVRHQVIPQDIDPSFPTSEPEDEADEQYGKGYDGGSGDHIWLHGELEDLHHDRDRRGRKKKGSVPSPKRCRSPPPSGRGRSPRKLSEQRSPRLRSPPPPRRNSKLDIISSMNDGGGIDFKRLAIRPGPMQTKSLPRRSGSVFPHLKARKLRGSVTSTTSPTGQTHVRGAIDIVKGLEKKRQRRREKYQQKYYDRARKEKAHTKRPPPGQGAERMKELGLIMAGKAGHGNYVISI